MAKYEHTVTTEEAGLTINQILRMNYKFSARFRTKMKYQSLVDLNGTPTPGYIKPGVGDVIGVRLPEESSDFAPEVLSTTTICSAAPRATSRATLYSFFTWIRSAC